MECTGEMRDFCLLSRVREQNESGISSRAGFPEPPSASLITS